MNKRVENHLKQMSKAMPEVKRQVDVYEKNISRKYAIYLREIYASISVGNGGSLRTNLDCFVDTGLVKDLITEDSTFDRKINTLHVFRDRIYQFAEYKNFTVHILTFENFTKC